MWVARSRFDLAVRRHAVNPADGDEIVLRCDTESVNRAATEVGKTARGKAAGHFSEPCPSRREEPAQLSASVELEQPRIPGLGA